ncbi:MAG: prolipoprotein diacylglyceryl transferase, partial [Candidatus Omnitrophica bacterium]|nr:prolipoprotein diacylglyceryl transferase [Candidatus Omnitrophota bacterium]
MHPNLFSIGPLTLHSYGLLVALGILAASSYLTRNALRVGKSQDEMIDLILVTTVSGFIGARLLYVIYEFPYFSEHPSEILAIWKGGIILYGGLLGGFVGFLGFLSWKKWPILKTLDLFTPAMALAHGFGRIGCFLNGCCYGKETLCPLGVVFPFSQSALHPTQLYEAVFCFGLFVFLAVLYRKHREQAGLTSFLYFVIYSMGRFVIEFLRNDMDRLAFGLTLAQWMSIGIFSGAVIIFIILSFKKGTGFLLSAKNRGETR